MRSHLIGELVRLRLKLLWSRVRTRSGKIALLIAGYLLIMLAMALVSRGGMAAAMVAVRSGRAQMVAQIVLAAVFVQAVLASAILGFGMNAIFSDYELRRYPVSALDRHLIRNLIAIVDPYWFLVLAMDSGLAIGLYLLGVASLFLGILATLLLFVCNYVFARAFGLFVDRVAQRKIAAPLFVVAVLGLTIGIKQIPLWLNRDPALAKAVFGALRYTPPFGAAIAITTSGVEAISGIAVMFWWIIGLSTAAVALEGRPNQRQDGLGTAMAFGSPYDRIAAWFGPKDAPLIAHWLRFYARNNRVRAQSLLALPALAILTGALGGGGSRNLFLAALGTFPLATFVNVDRFTVNQFGYSDSGLRRYFLLPIDPAAVLRTGSYVSLLLGSAVAVLALIGWVILAPPPFDARMLFMLIASSITGMLAFRGLGLWSTVIAPRRCKYGQFTMMGDPMSLVGSVVVLGSMLACLLAPGAALQLAPALVSPELWWIAPLPVIVALAFYALSLRATGALLRRRRERLIAVVEGKS